MRLVVNGMERSVRDGLTVAELLEVDGEPARHVLVEVNGLHVLHHEYSSHVLRDGDRVEIVLPAFGG